MNDKPRFPQTALLEWFEKNQRSLPWRKNYSPYEVWLSEVMLQQTRVDQMLPYYKRFLEQFPSVETLAQAQEEKVLKAWEGLGYYSRARNLQKAAQQIIAEHNGKMPQTKKQLIQLSGFGEYISRSVSSIAFNENEAVVDGNVFRVLARFFGNPNDIAKPNTRKEFQAIAEHILPNGKARFFNQAMMELGAMICVPDNPLCNQCPLHQNCFAFQKGQQNRFPVKSKKAKRPTKTFAAVFLRENDSVWIEKRSQKLLQGLYELPMVLFHPLTDSLATVEKKIEEQFGAKIKIQQQIGEAEHEYTHFKQKAILFQAKRTEQKPVQMVSLQKLSELPQTKINQKLLSCNNPS